MFGLFCLVVGFVGLVGLLFIILVGVALLLDFCFGRYVVFWVVWCVDGLGFSSL